MRFFLLILLAGCAAAPVAPVATVRARPAGELLFNGETNRGVNCSRCHGDKAQGLAGGGPGLAYRVPKLSDAEIDKAIISGKGRMPAFAGKISESELSEIRTWLRARFP